jgi:hypothetical protein
MILLLLASAALQPLAPPTPPIPTARTGTTLPPRTPVRLVTTVEVSSRGLVQGQRIPLRLAEDLAGGGRVLVPAGTAAVGEIEALSEKGMFGKAAKFTLQPLFIDAGGRRINLAGRHREAGEKGTTTAAVATVFAGTLGLFITGKSAKLAAGSELMAEVRDDTPLP